MLRALSTLTLFALAGCGATSAAADSAGSSTWLDGQERSILVVGYSTSFAWPAMLQVMLDEHAGGERRYHVLNAVIGGCPVGMWISAEGSRDHERTVTPMLRDFFGPDARLRGGAPAPTLAICQQSLQYSVEGAPRGPVTSAHDMAGAELGADLLQRMCARLQGFGVTDVLIAMHIYKPPVEPEVGNERVALARLLSRGLEHVHAGPDVWEPTRDQHPECFDEDGIHPNELGMELMAAGWYRSLAGGAARESVVEALHARDWDVDAMMRQYLAWRRGEGPAPGPIYR